MIRQLDRPIREAWIVAALRTPFGRYGGHWRRSGRTIWPPR